ncbi:MAG: BamA/TamA family outer membrane protein [Bacteroidales bacterium]|jgi:outer membrane protein assembly factor BamA|nr:BamA/TamA family outer membrane protein [Bacteroidales bacterium]
MMLLRFFRLIVKVISGSLIILLISPGLYAREPLLQPVVYDSSFITIRHIEIAGNSITRPSIILREMKFREGDSLLRSDLVKQLSASQENIFNTRLFNIVTIDTLPVKGIPKTDIRISVTERWYIWPIPFFQISDRNFNVWWETRDFSRLTYGVDFTFSNVRGRNETLKIMTHFGYNQKYGFTYKIPYIDRKQKLGIGFGAEVDLNHEIVVTSENNKPVYFKDGSSFLKKLVYGYLELIVRPDFYTTHTMRVSYNYYDFEDRLLGVPGFFFDESVIQQFATINYFFKNDKRDVQFYPLKGYYIDVEFNYTIPFMEAHNAYIKGNFRKYWQLHQRWYWASGFTGKLSLEKEQPYFLQQGLGYGREFVRGYEYYVIDGQHFALLKNNLKFALLPQRLARLGFINTSKFNPIPLALYINAFADVGYVYNYQDQNPWNRSINNNTLQNSLLVGYGVGLDFTTYYDIVIRMEISVNAMGSAGFYLHFMAPI